MNIAWWLEHAADEAGEHVALIDGAADERVTYAQLRDRAEALAAALRDEVRVGPGDVVATIMPDDCWHTAIFYGLLRLGATFTGFNRTLAKEKFATDIERSQVRVLIVGQDFVEVGRELLNETCVEELLVCGDDVPDGLRDLRRLAGTERDQVRITPCLADEIAAVNFTGGTSGVAKGVIFTHGKLTLSAQASVFYDRLTSRDVNLSVISLYHSGGIHDAVKWTMVTATNVLSGGWQVERCRDLIGAHGVTWISFWVPTMIRDLMRHPAFETIPLERMSAILCGEAVPPELEQALLDRGMNVSNSYGMTETMPVGILKPLVAYGDRAPAGSAGRPMPELCEVVLKDLVTGEPITEPSIAGEICVRGGVTTPGYHNDPERTSDAFDDEGFLHTRDLASIDDDGWFWLGGRTDDIINTGAEKLSLLEIEAALRGHSDVLDVACVGVRHARFGEAPAAFVVVSGDQDESTVAHTLDEHCLSYLERWKRPRLYAVVDAIPRTLPKRTKDLSRLRAMLAGIEVSDESAVTTLGTATRSRPGGL
ncbi:MAG TPA: class I adenylate-forming enzyme family protein [Solirubrobacteraceae bacterium]|jgi:acyl-CoA synthetase (AMP-forming)/AMP-acid ligase II